MHGARLLRSGALLIDRRTVGGLRVSEATGGDIESLGLERGHSTLTILRKGGKVVTIPLALRTARAVDLAVDERCEGPIFLGADGERLDRHAAGRIVRRVARQAGITKRVGPHTLRHTFITAALDAGVPRRDVQETASHADPRTTMRYDRARVSLDRHATYIVATFLAGAARSIRPARSGRRTAPERAGQFGASGQTVSERDDQRPLCGGTREGEPREGEHRGAAQTERRTRRHAAAVARLEPLEPS